MPDPEVFFKVALMRMNALGRASPRFEFIAPLLAVWVRQTRKSRFINLNLAFNYLPFRELNAARARRIF